MPTAMSTFSSDKQPLQDILNDIHSGKIQLPDFQRDWRWDDDHIRDLLASVSLSYPIGAVLLLETGGVDGRFGPRLVDGVNFLIMPEPQYLILDGQQRLTALYQVLRSGQVVNTRDTKGKKIRRWYYLDIQKALDPNADRKEAIISVPEERAVRNFRGEIIEDYSNLDRECTAGLLPLRLIYDVGGLFQWLDKFTRPTDPTIEEQRRELRNKLTADVITRVQQYPLPIIQLKRETPKEAVCLVFEKLNTGGVSLDIFELLTATYAADNYRLRNDWAARESRLRQQPMLRSVSSSDFVMAATLLSSWERQQGDSQTPVSCKRKDILRLPLSEYRRTADRLTEGFEKSARFLLRQKVFQAKDIPYQTQLVPLAAILSALGDQAEHDTVKNQLARWFWCGVFGELYGSAIESRFAKDLPEVVGWIRGGSEPSTVQDSNFAAQRLLGLRTRNSAAYKGLSALLMREGSVDFRTGDPIDMQVYFDDNIDIHHIFPAKVCEDMEIDTQKSNCVVNKTPLSARTNRMIGRNLPSDYLDNLQRRGNIARDRMDQILRSHLVDPIALRQNDFNNFFEARQSSLLSLIERATGKIVFRGEPFGESVESETDDTQSEQVELEAEQ